MELVIKIQILFAFPIHINTLGNFPSYEKIIGQTGSFRFITETNQGAGKLNSD